jgi:hypothetical protein
VTVPFPRGTRAKHQWRLNTVEKQATKMNLEFAICFTPFELESPSWTLSVAIILAIWEERQTKLLIGTPLSDTST